MLPAASVFTRCSAGPINSTLMQVATLSACVTVSCSEEAGCSAQIAGQINTFILAGYETTASALAFAVYHLAANPKAEARLLQEVDAFGRDAEPTYEDLSTEVLDFSVELMQSVSD